VTELIARGVDEDEINSDLITNTKMKLLLAQLELVERGYTQTELEGKDWKELTAILKAQDQKLCIKLMHDDNLEDGVLGLIITLASRSYFFKIKLKPETQRNKLTLNLRGVINGSRSSPTSPALASILQIDQSLQALPPDATLLRDMTNDAGEFLHDLDVVKQTLKMKSRLL